MDKNLRRGFLDSGFRRNDIERLQILPDGSRKAMVKRCDYVSIIGIMVYERAFYAAL